MSGVVKIGQVRLYSHEHMGDLVYLVVNKQDPPWIDHATPFEWVLLILDGKGPHLEYVAPAGTLCGADDYWLLSNTKVIT